jgi:sorting nexin-27
MKLKRTASADDVYNALIEIIDLDKDLVKYFYLFEIIDYSFDRKLRANECPHLIYTQNYSTSLATCIAMKRWYFNLKVESILAKNTQTLNFLYYQVSQLKIFSFSKYYK